MISNNVHLQHTPERSWLILIVCQPIWGYLMLGNHFHWKFIFPFFVQLFRKIYFSHSPISHRPIFIQAQFLWEDTELTLYFLLRCFQWHLYVLKQDLMTWRSFPGYHIKKMLLSVPGGIWIWETLVTFKSII